MNDFFIYCWQPTTQWQTLTMHNVCFLVAIVNTGWRFHKWTWITGDACGVTSEGLQFVSTVVCVWHGWVNYHTALFVLGLAVGLLAENIISHQGMVTTASCGYKAYKSPAVVQDSLSITEAHADTFTFILACQHLEFHLLFDWPCLNGLGVEHGEAIVISFDTLYSWHRF